MAVCAAMVSCSTSQEEIINPEVENAVNAVTIQAPEYSDLTDAATRMKVTAGNTLSYEWIATDTLGIFPMVGNQVEFPIGSGAGSNVATFDGGGWALKNGVQYAAYYPYSKFNYWRTGKTILLDYTCQTQTGDNNTTDLGNYVFSAAGSIAPVDGVLTFKLTALGAVYRFKLTVPEPGTYTGLVLVADKKLIPAQQSMDILKETPTLTAKTLDSRIAMKLNNVKTTEANQVLTIYMAIPAADLSTANLTARLVNDEGVVYETPSRAGRVWAAKGYYGFSAAVSKVDFHESITVPSYSSYEVEW